MQTVTAGLAPQRATVVVKLVTVIVQTLFSMQFLMGGQSVVTIPPARSCFDVQEALLTVQGTLE